MTGQEGKDIFFLIRNDSRLEIPMKQSIIKMVREKGLKLTPQRLAIIDVLVDKTFFHPGASIIVREAKKKVKTLSLSTVYSTLNELSRHGIIKAIEFDKMENRYEGDITDHINLICKRCKKIMDFASPLSIDRKKIARKAGFRVTDTRLECYGYCSACKKNLGDGL